MPAIGVLRRHDKASRLEPDPPVALCIASELPEHAAHRHCYPASGLIAEKLAEVFWLKLSMAVRRSASFEFCCQGLLSSAVSALAPPPPAPPPSAVLAHCAAPLALPGPFLAIQPLAGGVAAPVLLEPRPFGAAPVARQAGAVAGQLLGASLGLGALERRSWCASNPAASRLCDRKDPRKTGLLLAANCGHPVPAEHDTREETDSLGGKTGAFAAAALAFEEHAACEGDRAGHASLHQPVGTLAAEGSVDAEGLGARIGQSLGSSVEIAFGAALKNPVARHRFAHTQICVAGSGELIRPPEGAAST
mmetsp:Transcript_12977/g.36529  ORF Transcript_12977/g.36529 Transcript_12977/m.36529 type:complete len:306 (+) Transcript_12977:960-1877(+)